MAKTSKKDKDTATPPTEVVTRSDEGIPYTVDGEEVTALDEKRRELRIGGKAYHHTSENALGQWVYRSDK